MSFRNSAPLRTYGTEVEKGIAQQPAPYSKSIWPTKMIFGATFVTLIAGIILLSATSSSKDQVVQSMSVTSTTAKLSKSANPINYSLKRVGYNPLPYFESTYTSPLKYAFLDGYTAVIEPNVNMELHIYNEQSSGSYRYTVCPENAGQCQTGYYKSTVASATAPCPSGEGKCNEKPVEKATAPCPSGEGKCNEKPVEKATAPCPSGEGKCNEKPVEKATAPCPSGEGKCNTKPTMKDELQSTIKISCSTYDKYRITLETLNSKGEVIASQTDSAMCMYVRREIRNLSKDDLDHFLEASVTLNKIGDEEGVKLYGPNYRSSVYLSKFHFFNAAQQDQDHIHEGNGFMTQHLKLTNIFDAAVRAVDPSVSLPYWDYTIDNEAGFMGADSYVTKSSLFGSVKTPDSLSNGFTYSKDHIIDGAIQDGRWGNLKAERNDFFPSLNYGYGYMRSPWNFNPSPYVSRFSFNFGGNLAFPTCSSHYKILEYNSMMDFFDAIAFGPHGTTHTVLAGFYGCDKFNSLVEQGYINDDQGALSVCSMWSYITKDLWRYGYVTAKTGCTVTDDIDSSTCGFQCNIDDLDNMMTFLKPFISGNADTTKDGWKDAWFKFICGEGGQVFTGDHLESASPSDPTFWVIHPTIERLLHAKFMVGGFEDETWPTDSENDYVCEHAACYSSTTGLTDYSAECCYGHYENDRMYDAVSGDRSVKVGPTNSEILAKANPTSKDYGLDYIFDQFSWPQCDDDFETLLLGLASDHDAGISRGKSDHQIQANAKRAERMEKNRMMRELSMAKAAKSASNKNNNKSSKKGGK